MIRFPRLRFYFHFYFYFYVRFCLSVAHPLLIRRSALPKFKPRFAFWPGALPDVVARLQDSRRLPVIGFAYDHHERSLVRGLK